MPTDLYTLDDLRPAFGIAPALPQTPPAGALAALVSFWERCVAAEQTNPGRGGAFRYPAAYESRFDQGGDSRVAFVDLPIGLQRLVGGSVTDVWYALSEAGGSRSTPDNVRRLVSSTWARRSTPVASLASAVLSAWAVHHVWPCGATGSCDFGIPPIEYTGGYTRLLADQRAEAPVIFFDGEIHQHSVAYLLALLRFAPNAVVRVLDGRSDPAGDLLTPVAPRWGWRADGSGLWDPSASDGHEAAADALGSIDRLVLTGHADTIASVWSALGITRTSITELAAGLEAAVLRAELPYVDAPPVAPSARSTWRPDTGAEATRGRSHRRWLARLLARVQHSRDASAGGSAAALSAAADAHLAASREAVATSPLGAYAPELRAA